MVLVAGITIESRRLAWTSLVGR